MENLKFYLIITFNVEPERHTVDIGSVTLKKDDREYILDVVQSYVEGDYNELISCELAVDTDTFPDCKYDLKPIDLNNLDVAEVYVSGEDMVEEPDYATLFVVTTLDNGDTSTKAINLTFEQ